MEGKLETQCWICPKCHDDHGESQTCSKPSGPFMPAPDDNSYIAQQFRLVVAERDKLLGALTDISQMGCCRPITGLGPESDCKACQAQLAAYFISGKELP